MSEKLIDDLTLQEGVDFLATVDASLAGVIRRYGMPPLWKRPAGFATLVLIILEQQVSLRSARAAFDRLSARIGRITADRFLNLNDRELKAIGFSRQKITYCRGIACSIENGILDLERLHQMDTPSVLASLTGLRGVGQWTARIYLLMALDRPDVWPAGDLALRKSFAQLNRLPEIPDDAAMADIAQKWRPWRAVAARILWHYYLSTPKPQI
jgi:DNA-3-methyladenine glycosylase II